MLVEVLLKANREAAGAVAVDDGTLSLTYRRLTRLALVIRDSVKRETSCERVGIMLPASALFPASLFGVLWASRIAIPLNFLLSGDELAGVVKDAGLDRILTVGHFRELASKLPARALFLDDLPLRRKVFFAMLRPLPRPPVVARDDTAVILYTSGTTAEPKGVELTYGNLHSNASGAIASLDIHPPQTILNVLPPFHVFGLTANVIFPIMLRATVHAIPRFSPVGVVKTVAAKGVTMMMAIPSMYAAILRSKSAKPDTFRTVQLAISGGEPLADSVHAAFRERFGVELRQGYGLTETSPVVSACSVHAYKHGTVGRPLRGTEVRIIDTDGRALPAGGEGEILVRGPGVMKGYYRKPDATRGVLDAEGWFRTGDIGRLDDEGYLSITGRAKEMLIIGGENVFPREIEAALESHEAVLQAAVIGIPDDLRGEQPAAFVIPQPNATVDELTLRNHAKRVLAGFKVPKRVIIREDLPKGPTGKILKRRLRELL